MTRRAHSNRHQRRRAARGGARRSTGGMLLPRNRGNRRTSWWMIAFVVIAVLAIGAARVLPGGLLSGDDAGVTGGTITEEVPGATRADVVRVIDGDTLDVRGGGEDFRVRLFGVDAPESGEPCADEATERLEALAGGIVQLVADERREDPSERQLRYVYAADGTFIDEVLIEEGLALAWRDDGQFRDHLVALEEEARASGTGCLWAEE